MDAIKQSLYGLNLAPYLFGTLTFVALFVLLTVKRVRVMQPRRLWIMPAFVWIATAAVLAVMRPQTGTQIVCFVVLAVTGFGMGVLLCLSNSLIHDPATGAFTHRSSALSNGAAALMVALLVGYSPPNFWPEIVFLAGYVSGHCACLWRWSEHLRDAPEISAHTGF